MKASHVSEKKMLVGFKDKSHKQFAELIIRDNVMIFTENIFNIVYHASFCFQIEYN